MVDSATNRENTMTEPFGTEQEEAREGVRREEIKVAGSELVDKVKELLHQGNIRRIVIKHEGDTVMELPLTLAAVGVVFAPVLAAVGAFAALATNCSIVVERIIEEPAPSDPQAGGSPTRPLTD
jgi:hypothetical protein